MISCRDQNNRQTFEWASYNHSGLVHWFSARLPNGTVCVTKYTAAGNVYGRLCVSVWAYACVCLHTNVNVRVFKRTRESDVYIINVCSEYLQEEIHVNVCISVEWWQLWVVHREVKHTEEMCEDT